MSKKQIVEKVSMQLPAGAANPAPPVGTVLGQRGVNLMEFCKTFNAKTEKLEKNMPTPVVISIYKDKSFSLQIKTPPVSYLLMKAAKIKKGAMKPGMEDEVGFITKDQALEIAKQKMPDLNTNDIEKALKSVTGSARSINLGIKE